jgi:hypothetical protein
MKLKLAAVIRGKLTLKSAARHVIGSVDNDAVRALKTDRL